MKKIVLLLIALVGALTIQANGYTYLTFETTDGAKASVAVEALTLTISGTTLTAGTETFTLSNLSKMYFSTTDETTTGINEIYNLQIDNLLLESTEIYDLQGHKIDNRKLSDRQLPHGAYIVKTKSKTYKMIVK